MIIHIIVDDKFLDVAWDVFERESPGNNKFILLSRKKKLKYIKRAPVTFMREKELSFFLNENPSFPVILHWMDNKKIKLLSTLKKTQKISWIGWGGDYYSLIKGFKYLESKTKSIQDRLRGNIFKRVREFESELRHSYYRSLLRKNLNKLDYFLPVIYEDYLLVKESNPDLPPYLAWNYGSIEELCPENPPVSGEGILLGNSASINNNHAEVIDVLSGFPSQNRVVCPLSYGDQKVAGFITRYGEEKLGERFIPLNNFLPLSDYLKLLSETRFLIMNHIRQQGFGNIWFGLVTGRIVFMNSSSPLYEGLKKLGVKIFSFQELREREGLEKFQLTEEEVMNNRSVMLQHYGKASLSEKTRKLIEMIFK